MLDAGPTLQGDTLNGVITFIDQKTAAMQGQPDEIRTIAQPGKLGKSVKVESHTRDTDTTNNIQPRSQPKKKPQVGTRSQGGDI